MEFSFYALAFDRSTYSTDTAPFSVFVRGIDNNLNTSEKLARKQSMQDWTTRKDICSTIIDCATKKLFSDFKILFGMCSESAPAICRKTEQWLCCTYITI